MWKENKYRSNRHPIEHWSWAVERTYRHFYHVGPTESLRNFMEEALMIKPGYEVHDEPARIGRQDQLSLFPLSSG